MSVDKQCDENLILADDELQQQVHAPRVELLHTLANPRNEHLSLSLEMLWGP